MLCITLPCRRGSHPYSTRLNCKTIIWEHVTVASGSRIGNKALASTPRTHEGTSTEGVVNHYLVKGVEIPKALGYHFVRSVWKARCSEILLSQWEKSVQQGNYSVCIVMYVDLCLWTVLRYFVIFIDDYTRYCKVYFTKNKFEVFNKFKEFEFCTTK